MAFFLQCILFHQWTPWMIVGWLDVPRILDPSREFRVCERCSKRQERFRKVL